MTTDPTFHELSTLDGELLPERTVLSAMVTPGGFFEGAGPGVKGVEKDVQNVVRPLAKVSFGG